MSQPESNTPTPIDLLLKEYEHRFTEVMFHSTSYRKQTDYIHLFITILIVLSPFVFSEKVTDYLNKQTSLGAQAQPILYGAFLILGAIVAFYFFTAILDSLSMIYLNGARLAAIEKLINTKVKEELLVWDSKIIPQFFSVNFLQEKGWIKPNVFMGLWVFLLFIIVTNILCLLCYLFFRSAFWIYFPVIALLSFFHIYQWILLHTYGLRHMRNQVNQSSNITEQVVEESVNWFDGIKFEHLIAGLTFIVGFLIPLVLSIKSHAFWFSSNYNFPLLSLPSIWLGDAILWPLFNYRFCKLLKAQIASVSFHIYKRHLIVILIIAALVSILVNAYLHYTWVHDPYTGFMDTVLGRLSGAGWWHLIFSTFQMSALLLFLGDWVLVSIHKCERDFDFAFKTWLIFVLFTLISILDFFIRHNYVLKTSGLFYALKTDWSSLLTVIFSISIVIIARVTKWKVIWKS